MCKPLKILIAVFCIILLAVIVNAHSNIYGGEDSGWDGGGSHASGTTIKYCIDTSVSSTDAQRVMSAAAAWSGTCTFTKTSSGYIGTVTTAYSAFSGTMAFFVPGSSSNGHYTSWTIKINTAYTVTVPELTHEFGHAIGLHDLYDSSNYNKIMCYDEYYCTASAPTYYDIMGAKAIIGTHSAHTYGSYGSHASGPNGNMHKKYCNTCNGWNAEYCTYPQNSDYCIFCGRHRYLNT